ncbi:MAG: acetoacetate decarboxylase family protein [Candidatus Hodarchaeales archaeon]|jgi:acetoacetate decarboxylase
MSFIKTKEEIERINKAEFIFYGAEFAFVYWLTKKEVIEKLLPPPLKPFEEPLVMAYISNFPKISFGSPYKEGAIFLSTQYEGTPGVYCLSMPVTEDIAMAGGREFFGFPKKIAEVSKSKEGNTIRGSVKRHGIQFFEIEIDLEEDSNEERAGEILLSLQSNPKGTPNYNFMHSYQPGTGKLSKPVYLVEHYVESKNQQNFEYGSSKVIFNKSTFDPWFEVEIETILGGFHTVQDSIMRKGKILAEVDPDDYAPYAYKIWDPLPED